LTILVEGGILSLTPRGESSHFGYLHGLSTPYTTRA